MEKIAIIGMGISGMAILNSYKKVLDPADYQIDCYDSKDYYGKGFPFREDVDQALLNVRPEAISYDYENPGDFVNWLNSIGYSYESYVPRHVLGDYMRIRLDESLKADHVNLVLDQVQDLTYDQDKKLWTLRTQSGHLGSYDRIHLCNGTMPQVDHYDLKGHKAYVHDIYPMEDCLGHIGHGSTIGILGTSLSAIDVARYAYETLSPKKILMTSRSSSFPTARHRVDNIEIKYFNDSNVQAYIKKGKFYIGFDQVDRLFEAEIQDQGASYQALKNKYASGFEAMINSLDEDPQILGPK